MFAKKFAVAVAVMLTVTVGITECVAQSAKFDKSFIMDMSGLPRQPTIPPELTGKKLKELSVCISKEVNYFDADDMEKRFPKGTLVHFASDLPSLLKPPATLEANGKQVLVAMERYLVDSGFNVASNHNDTCVVLKLDYAEYLVNITTFFLARGRISYLGKEVVLDRDDRFVAKYKTGDRFFDNGPTLQDATDLVGAIVVERILRAFDFFVAEQKTQESLTR